MQELSFTLKAAAWQTCGMRRHVEVFTFENVYTPEKFIRRGGETVATELTSPAGTKLSGALRVAETETPGGTDVRLSVAADKRLRCVKLTVCIPVAADTIYGPIDGPHPVTDSGEILTYPEGWRGLVTPFLALGAGKRYFCFESLDTRVSEKRFTVKRTAEGVRVELIYEPPASEMSGSIEAPAWRITETDDLAASRLAHEARVREAYGLRPFAEREDVPAWLTEISLVAAVHMQHWTGHIFNTYDEALRKLERLAQLLPGRRILAFLPGWEGRYYFRYGAYGPDERMGGEAGLLRLTEGAHALGVHVMPMYGIDMAGRGLENYEQWGRPSEFMTASGAKLERGSVDWDGSRHYDHFTNAILNPASPGWQDRLCGQIERLSEKFGFDAAFLDIAAVWVNDPNFPVTEGIVRLCRRLREKLPHFVVGGEGWYDGLSAAMPLFHAGHTDGKMNYHDGPLFTETAREFSHLSLGDPATGSTGVHELGYNAERTAPLRRGVLPTLTITDRTFDTPEYLANVRLAERYAEEFLGGAL